MNQIETMQLSHDQEWTTLQLSKGISKNSRLVAVSFRGMIVVFGGARKYSRSMHVLSEDGEQLIDMSQDRAIPGCMN